MKGGLFSALQNKSAQSALVQADEVTVVVLTGTGVKATPRIAEILGVEL